MFYEKADSLVNRLFDYSVVGQFSDFPSFRNAFVRNLNAEKAQNGC
jgi:hypothetical protein